MYYNGQIVYSYDKKSPVVVGVKGDGRWAWYVTDRTTHFIKATEEGYKLAMPKTVEEAVDLLEKGLIAPAPCLPTHHWRCRNWLSNHDRGHCICPKE